MILTDQQLLAYTAVLEAERDRVRALIDATDEDLVTSGISDPEGDSLSDVSAAATAIETHDRTTRIAEHERQMCRDIDAALARIAAGTYGTCSRCDRPIGTERLDALPWADHCIQCAANGATPGTAASTAGGALRGSL